MSSLRYRSRAAVMISGRALGLITEGELVVAMSGEFGPFSHFDNHVLTGFDYDIAEAIADQMGLRLTTETAAVSCRSKDCSAAATMR